MKVSNFLRMKVLRAATVSNASPGAGSDSGSGDSEWEEQFVGMIEGDSSKPVTKIPDVVTKIGNNAFHARDNILFTSLPPSVTTIENLGFYDCESLVLTSLPSNLTSIGDRAFYNCGSLALTHFPESLRTIGVQAFQYCTSLTTLTFKRKPTTISNNAFGSCTNLLTINVPWAEGEVAGAPWGATNATINYNYTGG